MLITEKRLKILIRKILKESKPGIMLPKLGHEEFGGGYKPSESALKSHDKRKLIKLLKTPEELERGQLVFDIVVGLSPAGILIDAKDIANAVKNEDEVEFLLSMAELIPGVGELRKAKKVQELNAKIRARDAEGAIELIKNTKKAQK